MSDKTLIHSSDASLYERYGHFISPTYPQFLRKLGLNSGAGKAEGALISDERGKTYIDCSGGYGIYNVGHNHPEIIEALIGQLRSHQLNTKPLITDVSVRLAEELSRISPGKDNFAFICNSGSEAVDSAIKLARIHKGKKKIISAVNAFHGYTFGALSASGVSSFRRLFEPLVPDIHQVPYNDVNALRAAMTPDTAAVLLEPVQQEAGVVVPDKDYLKSVRSLCDEKGALLIIDEIKTGCGRTGSMFACDHFKVVPDILLMGKSLGGGLMPIGGLIAKHELLKKFSLSFPMSASSYAGNTLACRAALATLEVLQRDRVVLDVERKGLMIMDHLRETIGKYKGALLSVSGLGLLIGMETRYAGTALSISKEMVKEGVIAMPAFAKPSVLMIEPPLVISFDQIKKALDALDQACGRLL